MRGEGNIVYIQCIDRSHRSAFQTNRDLGTGYTSWSRPRSASGLIGRIRETLEDADAIRSADELFAWDAKTQSGQCITGWLPDRRPLRVGLLAGASSPEIVIGDVLQRLAECLE